MVKQPRGAWNACVGYDSLAILDPMTVARDYLSVLSHPVCLGNAICNAAAAARIAMRKSYSATTAGAFGDKPRWRG